MKPPPPLAERRKPGLSATLTGERRPDVCQSCGKRDDLRTWSECDEWDAPQVPAVFVVLCERCSRRMIDTHPRLYLRIDRLEPRPGVMALCIGCRYRQALRCTHSSLRANGGPGLEIHFPKPEVVHLNYGGGRGEWKNLYPGPPTYCVGRDDGPALASVAQPAPESHR